MSQQRLQLPVTRKKIEGLKAKGYAINGIAMEHKETNQAVIVNDFGKVIWVKSEK